MSWLYIVKNELLCFFRSSPALFILYCGLSILWGWLLYSNQDAGSALYSPLWLLFFSVIVNSNFANTTFVSERINGQLEVLLVSGLNRTHILFGKIVFVTVASLGMGLLVFCCAGCFSLVNGGTFFSWLHVFPLSGYVGFIAACFMNSAGSAFFSVWMPNPRFLHFVNLLVLSILTSLWALVAYYANLDEGFFWGILVFFGVLFTILASRSYRSEKIARPVSF